jgi:Na+-driven multidrug efflux pump
VWLKQGLAGAAWATSAAQMAACCYILWFFVRVATRERREERAAASPTLTEAEGAEEGANETALFAPPSRGDVVHFCGVGVPTAMVVVTKVCTYGALSAAATRLGTVTGAAHTVASNIFFLAAVFGDSVSSVAQAAMPEYLGVPRAAFRWAGLLLVVGGFVGIFNLCASSTMATIGAGLFTTSPEVVAEVQSVVPLMGAAVLLHAFSMATEGVLFAGAQLRYMICSYALNCSLALGALAAYSAASPAGLALTSLWAVKVRHARALVHACVRPPERV